MFKPGDQPIAGYKLIHFLGKGQFGEVWKASGPGGTEVALKFILLQQRTGIRELKSIQSVKLIRHANLLPVNAIWLLGMDGTVLDDAMLDQLLSDKPLPEGTMAIDVTQTLDNPQYLVVSMALADKSLEDLLKEAGGEGISHAELLDFMRQAAKGIDFLNSPR
ncbi:MAG: serine/threonine protein kinase, partial [Pirellulaceae bacterium]